jgi:hypothetical protein
MNLYKNNLGLTRVLVFRIYRLNSLAAFNLQVIGRPQLTREIRRERSDIIIQHELSLFPNVTISQEKPEFPRLFDRSELFIDKSREIRRLRSFPSAKPRPEIRERFQGTP